MSAGRTVGDYMTRSAVTLTPDMDVHDAARLLLKKRISGAPVVDSDDRLVGMLTEKDYFRVAFSASYHQLRAGPVSDHMSTTVETISPDVDIVTAVRRFFEGPYRRLPVIRDGRVVGVISRGDALRALFDLP